MRHGEAEAEPGGEERGACAGGVRQPEGALDAGRCLEMEDIHESFAAGGEQP